MTHPLHAQVSDRLLDLNELDVASLRAKVRKYMLYGVLDSSFDVLGM